MMSASPKDQQDDAAERQQSIDELDEPHPEAENEGGKPFFFLMRECLSYRSCVITPSLFTSI